MYLVGAWKTDSTCSCQRSFSSNTTTRYLAEQTLWVVITSVTISVVFFVVVVGVFWCFFFFFWGGGGGGGRLVFFIWSKTKFVFVSLIVSLLQMRHSCIIFNFFSVLHIGNQRVNIGIFHNQSSIISKWSQSFGIKCCISFTKIKNRIDPQYGALSYPAWASCQIRKVAGAHAPGMPGTFSPSPQMSDPDMHHGTCVTHVPWCMPGSPTSGFLWNRRRGKTFPAFPAHAQPAILRIW